jgi:hypothetical protein
MPRRALTGSCAVGVAVGEADDDDGPVTDAVVVVVVVVLLEGKAREEHVAPLIDGVGPARSVAHTARPISGDELTPPASRRPGPTAGAGLASFVEGDEVDFTPAAAMDLRRWVPAPRLHLSEGAGPWAVGLVPCPLGCMRLPVAAGAGAVGAGVVGASRGVETA